VGSLQMEDGTESLVTQAGMSKYAPPAPKKE